MYLPVDVVADGRRHRRCTAAAAAFLSQLLLSLHFFEGSRSFVTRSSMIDGPFTYVPRKARRELRVALKTPRLCTTLCTSHVIHSTI